MLLQVILFFLNDYFKFLAFITKISELDAYGPTKALNKKSYYSIHQDLKNYFSSLKKYYRTSYIASISFLERHWLQSHFFLSYQVLQYFQRSLCLEIKLQLPLMTSSWQNNKLHWRCLIAFMSSCYLRNLQLQRCC